MMGILQATQIQLMEHLSNHMSFTTKVISLGVIVRHGVNQTVSRTQSSCKPLQDYAGRMERNRSCECKTDRLELQPQGRKLEVG